MDTAIEIHSPVFCTRHIDSPEQTRLLNGERHIGDLVVDSEQRVSKVFFKTRNLVPDASRYAEKNCPYRGLPEGRPGFPHLVILFQSSTTLHFIPVVLDPAPTDPRAFATKPFAQPEGFPWDAFHQEINHSLQKVADEVARISRISKKTFVLKKALDELKEFANHLQYHRLPAIAASLCLLTPPSRYIELQTNFEGVRKKLNTELSQLEKQIDNRLSKKIAIQQNKENTGSSTNSLS